MISVCHYTSNRKDVSHCGLFSTIEWKRDVPKPLHIVEIIKVTRWFLRYITRSSFALYTVFFQPCHNVRDLIFTGNKWFSKLHLCW